MWGWPAGPPAGWLSVAAWLWLAPVAVADACGCLALPGWPGLAWPAGGLAVAGRAWPGLAWDSQPQPARQLKSRGSRIQAWRDSCNGNAFFLKSFLGILKKLFTKKAFPLRLCPQALMHGPLDFSCVAGCSVLPGAGQGWLRLSG